MASIASIQSGRFRVLKEGSRTSDQAMGPVVYWMFRDQRLKDNWALIHAVDQANKANVPVAIAFNLFDQFLGAKARQLGFMLRGLRQLHRSITETLQIPFILFQVNLAMHLKTTNYCFCFLGFYEFFREWSESEVCEEGNFSFRPCFRQPHNFFALVLQIQTKKGHLVH